MSTKASPYDFLFILNFNINYKIQVFGYAQQLEVKDLNGIDNIESLGLIDSKLLADLSFSKFSTRELKFFSLDNIDDLTILITHDINTWLIGQTICYRFEIGNNMIITHLDHSPLPYSIMIQAPLMSFHLVFYFVLLQDAP